MKPSLIRIGAVMLMAAFLAVVISGCQTSKGLGEDVEDLGEKIQEKSS